MAAQSQPPPPPGGGNAKYIVIALLFLAATVGVYCLTKPGEDPGPPPPIVDAGVRPRPMDELTFEELPDAAEDAEVDAGADAATKTKIVRVIRDNWDCPGSISEAAARAVISQNYAQVRNCYERRLKMNNLLSGRVQLTMKVNASGQVVDSRVGGNLRDDEVRQCVRRLSATWRFPAPEGGNCAVIGAPFNFTPRP